MNFERESRYIVIKNTDLEHAIFKGWITQEELDTLDNILCQVRNSRYYQGKPTLDCAVVESDWPEYEVVWKMIEDRVKGN